MFIDPNSSVSGDNSSVGVPGPERRRRPLGFYLRGVVRTPTWTFSDIAIDQPTVRGTGGVVVGAGGFVGGGYAAFLFSMLLLHAIGKAFEGEASVAEELAAMTYAALSLWVLVPTAALWVVADGARPWVMTLGVALTSVAAIRLTYIAIREANRFVGTQAILTMLMVPLGAGLLAIAVFFIFAFGTLILE